MEPMTALAFWQAIYIEAIHAGKTNTIASLMASEAVRNMRAVIAIKTSDVHL